MPAPASARGLQDDRSDVEALTRRGLPVLHTSADLADADRDGVEGPPLADLPSPGGHGGPLPPIRDRQEDRRGPLHLGPEAGSGVCPEVGASSTSSASWNPSPRPTGSSLAVRSSRNAAPHAGKAVVVNLDLKDFFPTITFRRVKGLFHKHRLRRARGDAPGLLCTEPPRVPAEA